MDVAVRTFPPSPRLLAAAPHRLLFFIGAANVLLAMAWWTLSLMAARWHAFALPAAPVPAGWLHALVMQYQVLTPFMFGFLLTVFPRWMSLPALTRRHYLPVGLGLLGGQVLTLLGALGHPDLLLAGVAVTLAGWLVGWVLLLGLLWRDQKTTWHAISCAVALGLGAFGLVLILLYLTTGNAVLAFVAIKLGAFGLLLPIYFSVCHRMIPFFAGSAVPGYRAWRPLAALAAFWALILAHLGLEVVHGYAALWIVDLPLAALCGTLLWRWWPRGAAMPALLKVLFIGFGWLPVAFALYASQSLWFAVTGDFVLARAPPHALFIGFFGSLLVAMVTRVTQGHSGRPLELGGVAAFAFALVQLVALTRIVAEFAPDAQAWQALAALGWLLAFLPWVLRSGWIYLTPRADGQPG
jgi:uncharacterized protein involved in response to NO